MNSKTLQPHSLRDMGPRFLLPKKQNSKQRGQRSKRTARSARPNKQKRANGSNGIGSTVLKTGFSIPAVPLFGMRTRKTIRYYTVGTVTSGASSSNAYVFSGNGVFDPDITGTGGQPMGFDQMMGFYNHYTVIKSRIRVVIMSNTTVLRATAALSVSGSSTATTSIEQLMENGNLTFQLLEYAGAMGSACTLNRTITSAVFQGVDDVMDVTDMSGDSASNPAEQYYYHINVFNTASATTVSIDFQVYLEYDVMFHEPRKQGISEPGLLSSRIARLHLETKEPFQSVDKTGCTLT